jgi:hypothetical protein
MIHRLFSVDQNIYGRLLFREEQKTGGNVGFNNSHNGDCEEYGLLGCNAV